MENKIVAPAAPKPRLAEADYQRAATLLHVPVATIKAVTEVESGGHGFLSDGRCIIRFEPHLFSRLTKGVYDKTLPDASFPVRKLGYPVSVNQSWQLFKKAAALNPAAAVRSTSWGLFQILGSNYVACDCESLTEFVQRMEASEAEQLLMFCSLILDWGLDDELQRKEWAIFSRVYNGPRYRTNNYDVRLATAFDKFSRDLPKS